MVPSTGRSTYPSEPRPVVGGRRPQHGSTRGTASPSTSGATRTGRAKATVARRAATVRGRRAWQEAGGLPGRGLRLLRPGRQRRPGLRALLPQPSHHAVGVTRSTWTTNTLRAFAIPTVTTPFGGCSSSTSMPCGWTRCMRWSMNPRNTSWPSCPNGWSRCEIESIPSDTMPPMPAAPMFVDTVQIEEIEEGRLYRSDVQTKLQRAFGGEVLAESCWLPTRRCRTSGWRTPCTPTSCVLAAPTRRWSMTSPGSVTADRSRPAT